MAIGKLEPSERRRRTLFAATLILSTAGIGALTALSEHGGPWRAVDLVRLSGLLALSLVLALRSTTALRFTPRNAALDDELTRANRASAATWGFWALMLATLGSFAASFSWPITIAQAAPILVAAGAAAAGMRFVFLERRGSS